MKKTFIIFLAAATAFCACTKQNLTKVEDNGSVLEIKVGAYIDDNATKTAFVPENGKVIWLKGDKLGLKYAKTESTKAKNDNVSLTLNAGENTTVGNFSGKLSNNTNAFPDGSVMVFYYPYVSTVKESGSVTDKNNIVLGGNFPKIQLNNNTLFDANLMYAIATDVQVYPVAPSDTTYSTTSIEVKMKNVMSVIDFTLKGEGKVKRLFVTDLNTSAKAMTGKYTVNITNGEFAGFATLPEGTQEYSRTICVEFQKAIELSTAGAHAYITVMPRTFFAGIKVGIEMEDGDYMVKTMSSEFTTESNKVYTAPAITFVSQKEEGKGFFENTVYSYSTFTDSRDQNIYKYAKLADGKEWMLENLRYIPQDSEGRPLYTPSADLKNFNNGIWYPVLINAAGNGVAFNNSSEAVARYGYLYNVSVALGKDAEYIYDMEKDVVVDSTVKAAAALTELKGIDTVGICPAGWHIPSEASYNALLKASGSSISGLGVQGFSLRDFGYYNVNNITKKANPAAPVYPTTGTANGWVSPKINMTYMLLSTPYSYCQYMAVMTNVNNNTANTAKVNSLCGVPVRCMKNDQE